MENVQSTLCYTNGCYLLKCVQKYCTGLEYLHNYLLITLIRFCTIPLRWLTTIFGVLALPAIKNHTPPDSCVVWCCRVRKFYFCVIWRPLSSIMHVKSNRSFNLLSPQSNSQLSSRRSWEETDVASSVWRWWCSKVTALGFICHKRAWLSRSWPLLSSSFFTAFHFHPLPCLLSFSFIYLLYFIIILFRSF